MAPYYSIGCHLCLYTLARRCDCTSLFRGVMPIRDTAWVSCPSCALELALGYQSLGVAFHTADAA